MKLNKSTSYRILDQNQIHFITIGTIGWIDLFIRKKYKNILIDSLIYCQKHKGLRIYAFVIMTNHIHLIVRAKNGHHLSDILRDFKKHTSRTLIAAISEKGESRKEWLHYLMRKAGKQNYRNRIFQVWKNDNHPIHIYSEKVFQQKKDYIHQNPVVEGIVEKADQYIYSSAYKPIEGKVLIELDAFD